MGNYILMKNSILILSLALSSSLFCSELSWVDEQISAIKPARQGMEKRTLKIINDPFIFLAKNRGKEDKVEKKKSSSAGRISRSRTHSSGRVKSRSNTSRVGNKHFTLGVIMNNTAMINGRWYKIGDKISGFTLKQIERNSVLLVRNNRKVYLSTKSINKNLHFKK